MRDIDICLDPAVDRLLYKTTVIRQLEHNASQFVITLNEEFLGHTYRLVFQLNDNTSYYTTALTPVDDVITYPITNVLTFEAGTLILELQAYDTDQVLIKSAIVPFLVTRCIDNVPVIIPDDYQAYEDLVLTYMSKLVFDPNSVGADAFDMDNMVEGTTNKILTQAERDIIASVYPPAYGELYRFGNTTPMSVPTGATYTLIQPADTNFGPTLNVGYDAPNHAFVIQEAGVYWLCFTFSSYSATNGITLETAVFKNDTLLENAHTIRKFGNATDVNSVSTTALITCAVGDKLNVRVKHDNIGTVSLTVKCGNFNISKFSE